MSTRQADLLSSLYTLAWRADVKKDVEAKREIAELCRQHPFLARERAGMVKERQELKVALVRRKRRGLPLSPTPIRMNGWFREFGVGHRLPSGRAPRKPATRDAGVPGGQHRLAPARTTPATLTLTENITP